MKLFGQKNCRIKLDVKLMLQVLNWLAIADGVLTIGIIVSESSIYYICLAILMALPYVVFLYLSSCRELGLNHISRLTSISSTFATCWICQIGLFVYRNKSNPELLYGPPSQRALWVLFFYLIIVLLLNSGWVLRVWIRGAPYRI